VWFNTQYWVLTKFKLNYILLGVGTDGHTASLMPYSDSLKEKIKHVTYTKTKQSNIKRMTLTYNIINNAQHISVPTPSKI
jgi:6-phosphogluconolactonase